HRPRSDNHGRPGPTAASAALDARVRAPAIRAKARDLVDRARRRRCRRPRALSPGPPAVRRALRVLPGGGRLGAARPGDLSERSLSWRNPLRRSWGTLFRRLSIRRLSTRRLSIRRLLIFLGARFLQLRRALRAVAGGLFVVLPACLGRVRLFGAALSLPDVVSSD